MRIGSILNGHYRIESQLGTGGFGEVFKAQNTNTGQFFAIKQIGYDPDWSQTTRADVKEQFKKEVNLARKLSHPNLQKFVEEFWIGGEHFLVTELEKGKTLRVWIKSGVRFSLEESIGITLQILDGLAVMHAQGVTHFDVKDENIIYDKDGNKKAVLLDFGISRSNGVGGATRFKYAHTPFFGAPEQAEKGVHDFRTDIYSLGVTLYELLTLNARNLFPADPSERKPTDLLDFSALSPNVRAVVKKATEVLPERRYSTVQEMATALRAILSPAPKINFPSKQQSAPNRLHSPLGRQAPKMPPPPRNQFAGFPTLPPLPPLPRPKLPITSLVAKPTHLKLGKVEWYGITTASVSVDMNQHAILTMPKVTLQGNPNWLKVGTSSFNSSRTTVTINLEVVNKSQNPGHKNAAMTVEYDNHIVRVPISVEIGSMPVIVANPSAVQIIRPKSREVVTSVVINNIGGSGGKVTAGWQDDDEFVIGQPVWLQNSWPNTLKLSVNLKRYRGKRYQNKVIIYIRGHNDINDVIVQTTSIPFDVQF